MEGEAYVCTEGDGTVHIPAKYCIKTEQLTKVILKTVHYCFLFCNHLCLTETVKSGNMSAPTPPKKNTHTLPEYSFICQRSLRNSPLASRQDATMATGLGEILSKSADGLSYTHSATYLHIRCLYLNLLHLLLIGDAHLLQRVLQLLVAFQ